jgi:transcriptional regulator with XRE-family HTH domain
MSRFGISKQPVDVMESLAIRIRQLRKQSRISQQELARRSGVSYGSIKRFELSGEISLESLLKIAHVFNRLDDFNEVLTERDDQARLQKLFTNKR